VGSFIRYSLAEYPSYITLGAQKTRRSGREIPEGCQERGGSIRWICGVGVILIVFACPRSEAEGIAEGFNSERSEEIPVTRAAETSMR
jgi:hypothetical protein